MSKKGWSAVGSSELESETIGAAADEEGLSLEDGGVIVVDNPDKDDGENDQDTFLEHTGDTPHEAVEPKVPKGKYRADVDGLRAFAVLVVIVYHANESWIPSGFVGVDIFFVISGFVVAASLQGRSGGPAVEFLSSFYARRAKRLLPHSVLAITGSAFLLALLFPTWDTQANVSFDTGTAALFGGANIYLYHESVDYFMKDVAKDQFSNPFLHFWSLGAEEQYYLVYPMLVLLFRNRSVRCQIAVLTVFFFLSVFVCNHFQSEELGTEVSGAAYFLSPPRFWELAAGAILATWLPTDTGLGFTRFLENHSAVANALGAISGIGMVLSTVMLEHDNTFPLWSGLLPVLSATLYIAVGTASCSKLNRFFELSPIVYIGKISYALYIWHLPILAVFGMLVDPRDRSRATVATCIPFLLATFVTADLGFRHIEMPYRATKQISDVGSMLLAICTAYTAAAYIQSMTIVRGWQPDNSVPWVLALTTLWCGYLLTLPVLVESKKQAAVRFVGLFLLAACLQTRWKTLVGSPGH
mmetsp:Transcript_10063/g.22235  ORF Transcript_10063/g.22235 Transcript_10063/m.22235 type:complete len:527 (-) Transcript_10063:204-1784(-)